jgi:hypothetical protein
MLGICAIYYVCRRNSSNLTALKLGANNKIGAYIFWNTRGCFKLNNDTKAEIFTNFNTILVFDFDDFSEGLLQGHSTLFV